MRRWLTYAACVLALTAVYCSNLRLIAAADSLPTALVSLAAATDGTTRLDEFAPWLRTELPWTQGFVVAAPDGSYRSLYPVAQGLIAAPLLAPAAWLFGVENWEVPSQVVFARAAEKGIAALLAAIAVLVIFLALGELVERRWALVLAGVFAFGTVCWPIASQALWQQNGGQLFLALSLYLWIRWMRDRRIWLLAGVGAACAVAIAIRPTNAVFVLPFLVVVRGWRPLAALLLPCALVGGATAAHNWAVFGNLLGGYGRYAMANPEPFTALAGLLISPGRGLLVFSPVFVFSFVPLLQRWTNRELVVVCAASIALHFGVIAMWPVWHGGWSWGPRLLSEIGPHMTLLLGLAVPVLQKYKVLFGVLAASSIFIQGVGAYCYPGGGWDATPTPVDSRRVWDWRDDPIRRTAAAGLAMAPFESAYKLLSRESFNAAATWHDVPPDLLVMYHWWAFPPRAPEPRGERIAQQSCTLDTATVRVGETGSPLWLDVTVTAPGNEVYVELSSPGHPSSRTRAGRNRAASVLLDQPPAAWYDVKVIQVAPGRIIECAAGRADVETLRTLR